MQQASYDGFSYQTDDPVFLWHIDNGRSEPYPRELAIVKSYLERFPTRNNICIDVGGHIGTTSLPYSRLFSKIIAFEPNVKSYHYFVQNIKLNAVSNVELHNKGAYNKNTYCTVLHHGENSGCFYIKECDDSVLDSIEVVKLDDFGIQGAVDFIKIDTEGSELQVLEGAVDLIDKYKPLVQVETNYCSTQYFGYDKERIYEFFRQREYKIFDDDGNNPIFYRE